MPSLKRLFGSPFGIHKKHKDRTSPKSPKWKAKARETLVEPSSPVTINTATTIADRDQQSTREEESSSLDRAFSAGDDDDDGDSGQDFETTTSTFLDVCSTASVNGSDDNSDEFRTTILESTSISTCSNDFVCNSKDEDNSDDDDFRTTASESNSIFSFTTSRINDNEDDDDDFRTTVFELNAADTQNVDTTSRINGNEDDDDDDDFRTTVFEFNAADTQNVDNYEHMEKREEEDNDFRTTIIAPGCEETNIDADDDRRDGNSKLQLDYFSTADTKTNLSPDQKEHESPINAVVFEKRVETGSQSSSGVPKIDTITPMLPILSPCSYDDGHNLSDFDDYRSTISGLTEVTMQVGGKKKAQKPFLPPPPPSPSAQKMEAFLKTETEALRQLLATVRSGDDESTVVEESNRGASEAERMAREMEREMELLVQGHHDVLSTNSITNSTANDEKSEEGIPFSSEIACVGSPHSVCVRPSQDTPESNEFISDLRSIIHPSPDVVVFNHRIDHKMENLQNSNSQRSHRSTSSPRSISSRSTCSPRKDLFRKRGSLYKLKQDIERKKKLKKKKLRRRLRYTLRAFAVLFLLCSVAFLVNWRCRFPDQDVSTAAKSTMTQLKTTMRTGIDPRKREEAMALMTRTKKATQSYLMGILPTNQIDRAKDLVMKTVRQKSSYVFKEARYYAPIALQHTKLHLSRGVKATNAFALQQLDSYVWTTDTKASFSNSLKATNQYVRDRLEYAFTDRAVREQRVEEERRLQQLMEAAAAAAAREASEKQKELWTQTMFAGACAFVGSVATNYVWTLL